MSEAPEALQMRLNTLTHDARGPLTTILGYAEMLELGALQGEAALEAARTIRESALRLAKLLDDASLK